MSREELFYLLPYLLSLALSLGIFFYAWTHRTMRGVRAYTWFVGGQVLTVVGFIFEMISPNLETKILWDKFQWLTQFYLVALPFIIFSIVFTEYKPRRSTLLLGIVFVFIGVFTVLLFTDGIHHLIYPNPHLGDELPFPELKYNLTNSVYFFSAFGFGVTLFGLSLLLKRMVQPHNLYRKQYLTLFIGFLIPVVATMFVLAQIQITPQRDPAPFAFAIGNLIVAWGLFRYRLFDIGPIARELIVENMSDPVIVLDPYHRVVDANQAALSLIGKRTTEVIGHSSRDVLERWSVVSEMLKNPSQQRREITTKIKGELYYYDLSISSIMNKKNELLGRIVVARDITRHKNLEMNYRALSEELEQRVHERTEELRKSVEMYRAVVEHQTEFIVRWKPDRTRTFVNEAYCRYFGLTYEQAMQTDFISLVAEEDRQAVLDKIARLTAGEMEIETEIHRVPRPDGSFGWQEWTDHAIRDETGKVVEFQSIGRDITERKRAEDEIRKLSRVVEQSNVSIVITDTRGRIEYVNPYFSELTGYTIEETIGQNPRILQSGFTEKDVYQDLWKTIEDGKDWQGELCNRKKNGELYWEASIISPIFDSAGKVTHFVAVKTDITERKQAEQIILRQLAYDELMTKLLTRFATCSHDEMDAVIATALPDIAGFFGGEYVGFMILSDDQRSWDTLYHWHDLPMQQAKHPTERIQAGRLSWTENKILNGEAIKINSLSDYPTEAVREREFAESEGMKSLLTVPIKGKELSVSGAIDVAVYSRPIAWTDTDVMHLKLIGDAIANLLERKWAESALQKSEKKHRLLFESANDSIFIMEDERIMDCNSRTLEMFGCQREDIIGKSPVDFSPDIQPDGRSSTEKAVEKINAVLAGMPQFFEWKHCRSDTVLFDADVSLSLLELEDGTFIQAIVRDITLRKQAEEALRKSEERFSKAFRASPIIITISQISTAKLLEVNETFEKISGYTREEAIGKTTFDLNLWADPADRDDSLSRLLESGEIRSHELQFRVKDGTILTCLLSADLIELGGEQCVLATIEDISERKRAEARILRLNRLYGTISQINQTIVHARTRENLFREICRVAIEHGQFRMAWIGLLDKEIDRVRPVEFSGYEQGYLENLEVNYRDKIMGGGPTGTAIREGRCVICDDIDNDPRMVPWREKALARGYRSSAAVPLREHGLVIGALTVYAGEPHGFDTENEELLEQIGMDVSFALDSLDVDVQRKRAEENLAAAYDTTLEGWAKALELRDKETEGHSRRVTETTLTVARAMGFSEAELVHIRRGSILHDIGKMGIPDDILRKNGPLTEADREIVFKHPITAYELLKPIAYLEAALEIPYSHHEKWDGSGYPLGLKGEQIPLSARIFAVVDVWDALSSDRPYRNAWAREKVADYLIHESGKHFDPKVVDVFLKLVEKGEI